MFYGKYSSKNMMRDCLYTLFVVENRKLYVFC